MLAKVCLAILLLPAAGYMAEAWLLSGYFIITVGSMLWRGLSRLKSVSGIHDKMIKDEVNMKIICISTSIIPAPTAHSMQLMKVCHALGQLGHSVELIVPGMAGVTWETLSKHYGLPLSFPIRYLKSIPAFKRYDFSLAALRYARLKQTRSDLYLAVTGGRDGSLDRDSHSTGITRSYYGPWLPHGCSNGF